MIHNRINKALPQKCNLTSLFIIDDDQFKEGAIWVLFAMGKYVSI